MTPIIQASYGANSYDKTPIRFSCTWDEFTDLYAGFAQVPRPATQRHKESETPFLSPFLLRTGAVGKTVLNTEACGAWFAADIDTEGWSPESLPSAIAAAPHIIHTTTFGGYRVIWQLSRELIPTESKSIWRYANDLVGNNVDPKTFNVNRLFYVPASWIGTDNKISICKTGSPMDIDAILPNYPVEDLRQSPPPVQAIGGITYGGTFLREWMKREYLATTAGTGRFFKMLCSMAKGAVEYGYAATKTQLATEAEAFDKLYSGKKRKSEYEAERALAWALATFQELSSMDKIRRRLGAHHDEEKREEEEEASATSPKQIVVHGVDADCGDGKSFSRLREIANKGGRTVYCTDKIASIQERMDEFRRYNPARSLAFEIMDAHSEKKSINATVIGQISAARYRIDHLPRDRPVLFFITHAAAVLTDWRQWQDFDLVIDENIDVLQTYMFELENNAALVKRAFSICDVEDDRYLLEVTAWGKHFALHEPNDEFDRHYWPLVSHAVRPWNRVWVEKKGWDDPTSDDIRFWTIVTPDFVRPFDEVWVMGDELSRSVLRNAWEFQGVQWVWEDIPATRTRAMPLSERLRVHYFVEHDDASFTRFDRKGDMPLLQICEFLIGQNLPPFIWTINERYRKRLDKNLGDKGLVMTGEYLTPRATGTNHYGHLTCAVWLAAMKVASSESHVINKACGMSMAELIRARELHALNQFVMRTSLRDYEAIDPVDVYVFSHKQAAYLLSRYGGSMSHIAGVVADLNKPNGRKPKGERAKTSTERADERRDRLREQGLSTRGKPLEGCATEPSSTEWRLNSVAHQNEVESGHQHRSGGETKPSDLMGNPLPIQMRDEMVAATAEVGSTKPAPAHAAFIAHMKQQLEAIRAVGLRSAESEPPPPPPRRDVMFDIPTLVRLLHPLTIDGTTYPSGTLGVTTDHDGMFFRMALEYRSATIPVLASDIELSCHE